MAKKDDLPAMMFYVGDWLKAPDIQCLDYETKGIWFEMLCYMWESNERGYLTYTIQELARLLRLSEDLLKQKLEQLLKRGIYSVRETDGAIYSRRMVRDQEIREIRKKSGSLGGKKSFAKRFAQAKNQANTEIETGTEIETEDVIEKNDKKIIPEFDEFFNYCKTLEIYHQSMDFQIQAKYNAWKENKWKDGNNKSIKNWKTKIQNTMPYFNQNKDQKNQNRQQLS